MDLVVLSLAKKGAKQYTDDVIDGIGRGVIYKGAVNYYNNLPNSPKEGECYTVLYKGTTGTESYNMEFVWGKLVSSGNYSWIKLGADDFSSYVTEITQSDYDNLQEKDPNVYYLIEEV